MGWNKINSFLYGAYGSAGFISERFEKWASNKGLKTWVPGYGINVPYCLKSGRQRPVYNSDDDINPPHIDHANFFKSKDKVWLVYHPYNIADNIRDDIEKWANKNNLHVEVYPYEDSWYGDHSSMVVVTVRD